MLSTAMVGGVKQGVKSKKVDVVLSTAILPATAIGGFSDIHCIRGV